MSEQLIIVVGSDNNLGLTLTKNETTFTIDPGATVKAALISLDRKTKYAGDVTSLESHPDADWANSLIIVPFTESDLSAVTYQGNALLEVQVDESGTKTTWFEGVAIVQGLVD